MGRVGERNSNLIYTSLGAASVVLAAVDDEEGCSGVAGNAGIVRTLVRFT